ncbi:uncharacterized protein LOC143525845 [Brachyhypopomus gauderio]|uniref:uncharacterized protein LOC143525845 n=1 Tax=Brachyhypopomus gauderio TaxID=698409 RepID=UPI0040428174
MATQTQPVMEKLTAFQSSKSKVTPQVKRNPADSDGYLKYLKHSSHIELSCNGADSPVSGPITIKVFDSSSGTQIPLSLESTDTIERLKQKLKEQKLKMEDMDLVYNGVIVQGPQTLLELRVMPGACFLPVYRCRGG